VSKASGSDRPLSIALVSTQTGWRGGEVQAALLARGLRARGHRCEVLARRGGELARRLADEGIPVHTFSGKGRSPLGLWQIRRFLTRLAPDVLHANDSHALTAAGLAGLGLPIAARVASRRVEFPLHSPRKYERLADRVVCVSQHVAHVCREQGLAEQRLRVVYDGVDPARVAAGCRSRGRQKLGLAPQQRLLLTVGALDSSKGHAFLLAALPAVLARFPEVVVAIVGEGPLADSLAKTARHLRVDRRVRWLGYRNDVADLIQAADLFVLPSCREGLGSSLIDAMLAEAPIVTTTAGGITELVGPLRGEAKVAWTVPPSVVQQLSAAILSALDSPELCAIRSAAAQSRARRLFTADCMVESTLSVYREVLARSDVQPWRPGKTTISKRQQRQAG